MGRTIETLSNRNVKLIRQAV